MSNVPKKGEQGFQLGFQKSKLGKIPPSKNQLELPFPEPKTSQGTPTVETAFRKFNNRLRVSPKQPNSMRDLWDSLRVGCNIVLVQDFCDADAVFKIGVPDVVIRSSKKDRVVTTRNGCSFMLKPASSLVLGSGEGESFSTACGGAAFALFETEQETKIWAAANDELFTKSANDRDAYDDAAFGEPADYCAEHSNPLVRRAVAVNQDATPMMLAKLADEFPLYVVTNRNASLPTLLHLWEHTAYREEVKRHPNWDELAAACYLVPPL